MTVDGRVGSAVDITGTAGYGMVKGMVKGQAVFVRSGEKQAFYAIGYDYLKEDRASWESEGEAVFHTLLSTVVFTDLVRPKTLPAYQTCRIPVSDDPEYGYSKEKPIAIGGGYVRSWERMKMFLSWLSGSSGEKLTYRALESFVFGNLRLYPYEIEGLSKPVTLYFNIFADSKPEIPVGLECTSKPVDEWMFTEEIYDPL